MRYVVVKRNIACADLIMIMCHLLNGFRATVCTKLKSYTPILQLRQAKNQRMNSTSRL